MVRSASRPGLQHRVELDAYDGNGSCTCERFMIQCASKLDRGVRVGTKTTRCSHIEIAFEFFGREMLRRIMIEQQENRRRRELGQ